MANRPNERMNGDGELRGDAQPAALTNGGVDAEPKKSRPSIRWVQLAYDLEQKGETNPDERGEVF